MSRTKTPEVVVITGASAGVGRATAHVFARQGAAIALLARGSEGLEGVRQEVEALGGRALVLPTDVSDHEAVEAAAEQTERELGPIDIWINCAMVTVFSAFHDMSPEEFKRVTEVTYLGYVHGTFAALKRMRPRNRGTIVQVGSALAYRSIPLQSAYCGAKHAIVGFTDSLRSELMHERSNVHLTAVHLPAVNTPQFSWAKNRMSGKPQPVPPIFQPEVPAEAIAWTARQRRREVLVGLSTWVAIEGNKIAPRLGDYYLARTAHEAQQRPTPADPNQPDNLWQPVPRDFGTHGEFDDQATSRSGYLWMTKHRRWLALLGVGITGAMYLMRNGRNATP